MRGWEERLGRGEMSAKSKELLTRPRSFYVYGLNPSRTFIPKILIAKPPI
jgi:hypothetical protein